MLAGEEDTEVTVGIKPQGVGGVLREVTLTRRTLVGAEPSSVESRTTPDQDRSGVGSAGRGGDGGLGAVLQYHLEHELEYVARLREAVAIPSVSLEPERRGDCDRMSTWLHAWAQDLGGVVETWSGEAAKPRDAQDPRGVGEGARTGRILLATFRGVRPETLVVHTHLDVRPAYSEDGWETDPLLLRCAHGALDGRVGGKADATAWLWAIESFVRCGVPLPLSIILIFDPGFHCGSPGLVGALNSACSGLGSDSKQKCKEPPCEGQELRVVHAVVCGSRKLSAGRGCVCHGCRGLLHATLTVRNRLEEGGAGAAWEDDGEALSPMEAAIQLTHALMGENGQRGGFFEEENVKAAWGGSVARVDAAACRSVVATLTTDELASLLPPGGRCPPAPSADALRIG